MKAPHKKEKRYKRFLLLNRKIDEVLKAKSNLGFIKLENPISYGFIKTNILRDDILRRKDAKYYQEVLDACNRAVWNKADDFIISDFEYMFMKNSEDYTLEKVSGTKNKYSEKVGKRRINDKEYNKLHVKSQKFFNRHEEELSWGGTRVFYKSNLSYQLVEKVSVSYITHKREHDSELEKKYSELSDEFSQLLAIGVDKRWKERLSEIFYRIERMEWRNDKSKILKGNRDIDGVPTKKKDRW